MDMRVKAIGRANAGPKLVFSPKRAGPSPAKKSYPNAKHYYWQAPLAPENVVTGNAWERSTSGGDCDARRSQTIRSAGSASNAGISNGGPIRGFDMGYVRARSSVDALNATSVSKVLLISLIYKAVDLLSFFT